MSNTVQLIGFYGGDIEHALSAWTSTSRELSEEKISRIPKLLTMLATDGHHTPFEKSSIHFLVTTEIATHIQLLKHRVGVSVNAESARYKELKEDKFYMPFDWDDEEKYKFDLYMQSAYEQYHQCLSRLKTKGFSVKRAKESARFYLPYGNEITSDIMFNFRSFYHFLKLRYSKHAQREISNLAKEMLQLVKDTGKFDITLKAFGLIDDEGNIRGEFE